MIREFGCEPNNIKAGIGPSMSPKNCEVGPEVVAIARESPYYRMDISTDSRGKGHLDIWTANVNQLLTMGVPRQNIEVAGICTIESYKDFYSYRYYKRDEKKTGRFGLGACLIASENASNKPSESLHQSF
jgi:copper oxidase (laccase) domain-containing protein